MYNENLAINLIQRLIQGGTQRASAPPLKKIVQKDRDTLIEQSL